MESSRSFLNCINFIAKMHSYVQNYQVDKINDYLLKNENGIKLSRTPRVKIARLRLAIEIEMLLKIETEAEMEKDTKMTDSRAILRKLKMVMIRKRRTCKVVNQCVVF